MHKNTPTLKKRIELTSDQVVTSHPASDRKISIERHSLLKNKYIGDTAFLITCGPSLRMVWTKKLEHFLREKLVISVKQALDLTGFITDFHIFNEVRMKPYQHSEQTILLSVSKYQTDFPSHIHYPIKSYKIEESLFYTQRYEYWSLNNSFIRPWGVGILFELGLQLPVYLGVRKIVIIGFDMNQKGPYHFYDNSQGENSNFYGVDPKEFEYAAKSIVHYQKWLEDNQVEVRLFSPMSRLNFERLESLEEVKEWTSK
jgi:hypothetical protein